MTATRRNQLTRKTVPAILAFVAVGGTADATEPAGRSATALSPSISAAAGAGARTPRGQVIVLKYKVSNSGRSTMLGPPHDDVVLEDCLWSKSTGFTLLDPELPGVVAVDVGVYGPSSISDSPAVHVPVVAGFGDTPRAARVRLAIGVRAMKDPLVGGGGTKVTDSGEEGTVAWAIVGPPLVDGLLLRAIHQTRKEAQARVRKQACRARLPESSE
jgi:hypothetical protein